MPLAGEILRASDPVQDDWTSYTPVWTCVTSAPSLGNGTLTGEYNQSGDIVFFAITLTAGGTTTFGTGPFLFSLPSVPELDSIFAGVAFDSSTNARYPAVGVIILASADGANMRIAVDAGAGSTIQSSVPFTWASGDKLSLRGFYRPG